MNLIRQIAFHIENATGPISSEQISVGDFSAQEIAYHCEMMNDHGLIVAHSTKTMRDSHPMFHISRLSPLGHAFVHAARNDGVWIRTMRMVKNRIGDMSIQLLIDLLKRGLYPEILTLKTMKFIIVLQLLLASSLLIVTGCDTPWAAAKRSREGITWQEWQQGIRSKEEKEQARIASQMREEEKVQEWLERRRRYAAGNPNLPNEIAQAIVNGRLARGMTEDHVAWAWAAVPDRVNTSHWGLGRAQAMRL